MPIVKIAKEFKKLEIGESLEVSATDPAFKADVEAWVRRCKQELISFDDNDVKVAVLKKIV